MVGKNKTPKIILVDWNKTLSFSKFWEHIQKKDEKQFIQIEKCLFHDNSHWINPWMKGEFTSEQICDFVSEKTGLSFEYIYKEFIQSCKQMKLSSNEVPKIIENIKGKGVKFYIFTDNMDSFDRWTVPCMKLNQIFDGILNSNKIGFLKNEINDHGKNQFLETILKTEPVETSEIMLIDDNESAINNFLRYGINCKLATKENTLEDILSKIN